MRQWLRDPVIHRLLTLAAYGAAGFCLSAASLGQQCLPLAMGFVWACGGWQAALAALGSALGYWVFWGAAGIQGLVWTGLGLAGALLLADRPICREFPLLIPSAGMLIVSASGLGFQLWAADTTAVGLHLLRVALGGGAPWVFIRGAAGKDPVAKWLAGGLMTLGLAQIAPVYWLGLGFVAAGAAGVAGAFPCAGAVGLALDLSGITPVPMTAVTVLTFFGRFLPRCPRYVRWAAPGLMGVAVMAICRRWDLPALPGLFLGGLLGCVLPGSGRAVPRRGETGVAQVRLEMAAGMLAQTQKLLLEVREPPVDRDSLARLAAERACSGCSCRKACRDSSRLEGLPGQLLEEPLLSVRELPVRCRKENRLLAELRRGREQLRCLLADRQRQQEYRAALVQQYGFLSRYLQDLSDGLCTYGREREPVYSPRIRVYGNRSREDNGDRCVQFAGTGNRYYIILCDGMGTGLGAAQEASTAVNLLQQLLRGGFPPEAALESLNSLCALRERAGAVTVDMAELSLDTGKVTLHKWGAAPSWLLEEDSAVKLGTVSPPPGLSVTAGREARCSLLLGKGQTLLMVSDGVETGSLPDRCVERPTPEHLARSLLENTGAQDDATLVTVQLVPTRQ